MSACIWRWRGRLKSPWSTTASLVPHEGLPSQWTSIVWRPSPKVPVWAPTLKTDRTRAGYSQRLWINKAVGYLSSELRTDVLKHHWSCALFFVADSKWVAAPQRFTAKASTWRTTIGRWYHPQIKPPSAQRLASQVRVLEDKANRMENLNLTQTEGLSPASKFQTSIFPPRSKPKGIKDSWKH